MTKLKWDKYHVSKCKRFHCYQGEQSGVWTLTDRSVRDEKGTAVRYACSTLSECKRVAQRLVDNG
jgi:hypothetical protein